MNKNIETNKAIFKAYPKLEDKEKRKMDEWYKKFSAKYPELTHNDFIELIGKIGIYLAEA